MERLARLEAEIRMHGVMKSARAMIHSLVGERPLKDFEEVRPHFMNMTGLEVGGPSNIFTENQLLPVYGVARRVDNCNFSEVTIWRDASRESSTFKVSDRWTGTQFICEGTDLKTVPDETYDFVLSSHTLEHIANPIRALNEWKRVIKWGGVLLLCLPNKMAMFDRRRATTGLDHLIQDFEGNVGEDDLTHAKENVQVYNRFSRPGMFGNIAPDYEQAAPEDNLRTRRMHHHTFTVESAVKVMEFVGFRILVATTHPPYHIIVVGQKPGDGSG